MNLSEWCNHYLRVYKSNRVKSSTLESYFYAAKLIDKNLTIDVTELELQEFVSRLNSLGKSVSTIKHTMTVINQALKKAYQLRKIDRMPVFETLDYPISAPKRINAFTQAEIDRLSRVLFQPGRYNDLFLFLLFTGMRVGEALALRWTDVDLHRRACTIIRTNYRGQILTPKTRRGIRTIPLTAEARFILRRRLEKRVVDDVIFNYSYYSVLDAFKRVCVRAGVEPRGVHALRHTYATFALRDGVNVKTLSVMLGHASVQFTMDVYCDVELSDKQKEAEKIGFFSRSFQPSGRSAVSDHLGKGVADVLLRTENPV